MEHYSKCNYARGLMGFWICFLFQALSPQLHSEIFAKSTEIVKPIFPQSLGDLTFVSFLGGSTGAVKMKDANEGYWVKKEGASFEHCLNEFDANQAYRALNVPVPPAQIYILSTKEGLKAAILSEFLNGISLKSYIKSGSKEQILAVKAQLRKHFVADCLLGNWDVIGLNMDNIIIDNTGTAWRIDNGGSLEYRAQGELKGTAFGPVVFELETLTDPFKNPEAAKIFQGITEEEIIIQIHEIEQRYEALLSAVSEKVRPMLKLRFEYLIHYCTKRIKEPGSHPLAKPQ